MKRNTILMIVVCALVVFGAFACKKDESSTTDTSTTSTSATDTSATTSTSATDTSNTGSAAAGTSTGPTGTDTSGTATQTAPSAASLSKDDQDFIIKAGEGGLGEVTLGNLAQQKSQNGDVKAFASRMVTDHGKANDELKQLASGKGVTLPTGPGKEGEAMQTRLQSKNGADFDKEYMAGQLKAHEETVKLFEKESKDGKDNDLKSWASKTLPTLKEHLKMAQETEKKAKAEKK